MNPVLTLTRNGLDNTKKAIESVWTQNIFVKMFVLDNGSTDGTQEWLKTYPDNSGNIINLILKDHNAGVSAGWNESLKELFQTYPHVLVINNDVILPPWFYAELLSYEVPFVTGVGVDDLGAIKSPAHRFPLQPCPDFSAFLIRREAWMKIGPFDEAMKYYAQDVDYHVRGAKVGVPLMKANVPYFHIGSSTLRNAPPEERAEINRQADADRMTFYNKWGFSVGSEQHHKAVGFDG